MKGNGKHLSNPDNRMAAREPRPARMLGWYSFRADNGLEVRVRRECPEDALYLVDIFEHMSPDSRYQRFREALVHPDPEFVWQEARRMAQLDEPEGAAWIAFADLPGRPDAPIAGARYVMVEEGVAELGVAVRDDLQHLGIGSHLLVYVLDQAKAAGLEKVVATFQTGNRAVWQMLQYSPYHVTWDTRGVETDVVIHLQPRIRKGQAI
jgi:acetyltransferase